MFYPDENSLSIFAREYHQDMITNCHDNDSMKQKMVHVYDHVDDDEFV